MSKPTSRPYRAIQALAMALPLFAADPTPASVSIQTLPIGNPGNAADMTGFGAVNYTYNIGKYEVTAGQYTDFLNAVAGVDPDGLYNLNMANTSVGSGIARTGAGTVVNPYVYSVDAAFVNRPVNTVNYWNACRFANWLQNGQPTGAEVAGITETGAYTITALGMSQQTITRNAGATWAVTSESEWYKAAYYNPATGTYFSYPTSSNTAPGNDLTDPSGNNANIFTGIGPFPIDSGIYTTIVGEFQNSASPYGTFDQAGNLSEWTEGHTGLFSHLRGGDFGRTASGTVSTFQVQDSPSTVDTEYGFRLVYLAPEPTSLGLLGLGVIHLWTRRKNPYPGQCPK